ncbi:GNAT family N-acetyltransferase [Pseudescherichia vulneris]|uniref:GNAT family N-acetyltransferase n=1 Tax=Pseudescherichia vulneris TaxID=566 RepID=UPI0030177A89
MISIRTAEAEDAPALACLFLQLGYATDVQTLRTQIQDGDNHRYILVAESAGRISGVIVVSIIMPLHENGAWGVISALVVDELYRGAKIGKRLLLEAEHFAESRGCTQIELSSSERREQAHKFYQKNGYQEVRKRFVKKLPSDLSWHQ